MSKKNRRLKAIKTGYPPGSLQYLGEKDPVDTDLQLFIYDEHHAEEINPLNPPVLFKPEEQPEKVFWLNLHGVHDAALMQQIGEHFGIYRMGLEDIMDTTQRPKIEEAGNYLFITLKSLVLMPDATISIEQFSFVLFENMVISFQEKRFDIFEKIRERIREKIGLTRSRKADYLLYLLLDAVVDHYNIITEHFESRVEQLEKEVLRRTDNRMILEIEALKKDLIISRNAVFPFKDAVQHLEKGYPPFIDPVNTRYFSDLKDNTLDTLDALDTCRQLTDSVMNLFINNRNNRLNEVMKVLTIIATIFIPLTFITGLYGMNFKNIPELEWTYGYYFIWGVCIAIALLMLLFFRKRKWI